MVLDAIVGFGVGSVPPLAHAEVPPLPMVAPAAPKEPAVKRANGNWTIEYRGRLWTVPGDTAESTVRTLAEQLKREADAPPSAIPLGNCPGGVCPVPKR
ncbi:MAG TPA: hypothetical protein VGJ05_15910 [Fimbriiglobus sp.]|jgi:hypothetical protein